jgi:PAS domain S-box-containing protein/diguanylate cyclase (GGDEF)-like protein
MRRKPYPVKNFLSSVANTVMFDSICDGITIQDRGYRILYQNKAHRDMFGSHDGELCYKAYACRDQVCERCPIKNVFSKGKAFEGELTRQTEKGISFFATTASPLKNKKGDIIAGIQVVRDITRQRLEDEEIRANEEKYRIIFNNAMDAICLIEPASLKIVDCNQKASELSGYTLKTLRAMNVMDLHPAEEQDIVARLLEKNAEMGHLSGIYGINQSRYDGIRIPVELNLASARIHGKDYTMYFARDISKHRQDEEKLLRDISEREKREGSLRDAGEKFRKIFRISSLGIAITDAGGKHVETNPAFQNMLGYTRDELMKGSVFITHPDDVEKCLSLFHEMVEGKLDHYQIEKRYLRKDGSMMWARLSAAAIRNERGDFKYSAAVIEDITELKTIEEKLQAAIATDALTGLFNRSGFFTLAEQKIKQAHMNREWMSLLYLDISGLRNINKKFGYKMGDLALHDAADILKRTFPESDIIARMGSDEFAVLMTALPEFKTEDAVMKHFSDNLQVINQQGGRFYKLLFNMGIADYDSWHPCPLEELLNQAETSMYDDKKLRSSQQENAPMRQPERPERRADRRYRTGSECWATLDGSDIAGIKDISRGGIGLKTTRRLTVSGTHVMKISPSVNGEIVSQGAVAWSSEGRSFHHEAGLEFIEPANDLIKSVKKFILMHSRQEIP